MPGSLFAWSCALPKMARCEIAAICLRKSDGMHKSLRSCVTGQMISKAQPGRGRMQNIACLSQFNCLRHHSKSEWFQEYFHSPLDAALQEKTQNEQVSNLSKGMLMHTFVIHILRCAVHAVSMSVCLKCAHDLRLNHDPHAVKSLLALVDSNALMLMLSCYLLLTNRHALKPALIFSCIEKDV